VAYDNNNERSNETIYSKRLKAGKLRTYFFDVRSTRANDYFITLTESKKRFQDGGYDRHKIFLYKEDFNKFLKALQETIDHVKTDLMPDFDFDAFNHDHPEGFENASASADSASYSNTESSSSEPASPGSDFTASTHSDDVEKW
jgi:hypothetical protein